jgi:nucleotide-binding universal stress UspA family protein
MRVLIGYDGSVYADAALDGLRRAGLPRAAEALVVSVGDGLVSTYSPMAEVAAGVLRARRVTSAMAAAREQAVRLLAEARGFASHARRRLLQHFPGWEVRTRVSEGLPARELLHRAAVWRPDLVVVGSQGRSALGRFFLGSVSEAVASRAPGSVRVGRGGPRSDSAAPPRIVVGVDGSGGARRAVRAVWAREWPAGTEVRLTVVDDGSGPTRVSGVTPRLEELFNGRGEGAPVNARLMAEAARVLLAEGGLSASVELREGDPRSVLADEARRWEADAIFVGSSGPGTLEEGSGLGSVSKALVTGAGCSVEVVR